jgi:hypothetical protein
LENDLPLVVKYYVASLGEVKLALSPLPSSWIGNFEKVNNTIKYYYLFYTLPSHIYSIYYIIFIQINRILLIGID